MSNIKKDNFISLVSDTTFKYLFKNKKTRKWLEEIIYSKTGIDLSDYILVDNEENSGGKVKNYIMDLVLSKNEEFVIIEMNNSYSKASTIKARQYLFRKASHGFDSGEKFDRQPNVKLIMFNNYYHRQKKDIKFINYNLYSPKYKLKYDDIEIFEIYLKLLHKMCYDKCNKIDKRLWLFGAESFKEMEAVKDNDNRIIIEELERLNMNDKFRDEYDYEVVQKKLINSAKDEGYEEGLLDGIEQGIINGVNQERLEIAKNLLDKNMELEEISEITKLSKDELTKLI